MNRVIKTKEKTQEIFDFAYKYCHDDNVKQGGKDINMSIFKCLDKILEVVYVVSWNKTKEGYVLSIKSVMLVSDYKIELFFTDEEAENLINKYAFPKLKIKFSKEEVIEYLINYQKWSRCADIDMPDVTTLGYIIDETIKLLKEK